MVQTFKKPPVKPRLNLLDFRRAVTGDIGSFRNESSDLPIAVLNRAFFPGRVAVAEVDLDAQDPSQFLVMSEQ